MALLRIPTARLAEFDLVVDLAVRQRGFNHEPRAETRLRVSLDNVIVDIANDDMAEVGTHVERTLVGQIVRSIVDLVDATTVVMPVEVPDGPAHA